MWLRVGTFFRTLRNSKYLRRCAQKHFKEFQKSLSTSHQILYAQPTSDSHPHLLNKGEITPGLPADVYNRRRKQFLQMVVNENAHSDNYGAHLILIPSASIIYMSENIPYPFRQSTDFLYLCGYKEPNSVLVLITSPHKNTDQSILFVKKATAVSERWEGPKMSLIETTNFLGVDETLHIEKFQDFLQSYARTHEKFTLWYDFSKSRSCPIHETVNSFLEAYPSRITLDTPRLILHRCRLQKCKYERALMHKTCSIAAEALQEVMKVSKPSVLESHLQAKMEYECRIRGADSPAFPPVVAGGSRANTIHYIDNNQVIKDNEMVLIDAGCEYSGYCSDLARTWPVNGKFTDPQRELYDLILSTQELLIERCLEKPSLDSLFKIMCIQLGRGLQKLGIIPKGLNEESVSKIAYEYCPHHVSHYLGMDVHDTDGISRGIKLLPGMVVTVEPGVYISRNDIKVPEKYRGICIRIEDDVLITENGVEVLTSACAKHPDDIEKLIVQKT